jgi:hypothetical protein
MRSSPLAIPDITSTLTPMTAAGVAVQGEAVASEQFAKVTGRIGDAPRIAQDRRPGS